MWANDDDCFTDMPYWAQALELFAIFGPLIPAYLGHPFIALLMFTVGILIVIPWLIDTNPKRSSL